VAVVPVGVADLKKVQLAGQVDEAAGSVDLTLSGELNVTKAGGRVRVLAGGAALSETTMGDGWRVELVRDGNGYAYDLVGERVGVLPVSLAFAATTREDGDWRVVNFQMPAGEVVPLRLTGLPAGGVEFNATGSVVPGVTPLGWQGYLPGDGHVVLAWRHTQKAAEGSLFFTSSEQTDVRVGAGLLRQASLLTFRVLQGKLPAVRLTLEGPGEILAVDGATVVGWKVVPDGKNRVLEVQLSRPFEGEGQLVVRSQTALGGFPVTAEPLRLTPEGTVRHSGEVRVANSGAVRLEVTGVEGMMQLAPGQFPGGPVEEGARQVFVYRFPAAAHAYQIAADQILPEVGVSQVVTYELGETDRVINAELELDVREAPLRDWSLEIPADYSVAGVGGNGVADYTAETPGAGARRTLKILFAQPMLGRILLQLRLEKNQPAAAGDWTLPMLAFPGAKTVRGQVGVTATAGYRITPALTGTPPAAAVTNLTEVPLSYFPKQSPGLQQAWRLRDADWAAALRIEARGQSVQADVYHLYSLAQGVVQVSVLFNYFVVGAPASEWRIAVPANAGNIDVTGQNVLHDWRRDGNVIIVTLHQPVLGAATLLVTLEEPMSGAGGVIHPGEVEPLNVQGERGFVQVVSPRQVKTTETQADGGLLRLEAAELPAEFQLLTDAPSLNVYQYTGRPFALALNVAWDQPGETVGQVVDFARLVSQVARDGQVVTTAQYFVKTRGRQTLRLTLPAGVKLWETKVDHATVNARTDGGQTLIPLPARLSPNEPVAVELSLGQSAAADSPRVSLAAPRLGDVPVVISEWNVRADPGRLLVPAGGNVPLTAPNLTETGREWLSHHAREEVVCLLLVVALAGLLLRARTGWRLPVGLLAGGLAVQMALSLASEARAQRRVNHQELAYAATVVPANQELTIQVDNVVAWRALVSWWGVEVGAAGLVLAGAALGLTGLRKTGAWLPGAAGVGLLGYGVLEQRGGAELFFWGVAGAVGLLLVLPGLVRGLGALGDWRKKRRDARREAEAGAAGVVSLLLLLGAAGLALGTPPDARAQQRDGASSPRYNGGPGILAGDPGQNEVKVAQALVQTWKIHDGRLFGEVVLTVRGSAGDRYLLLAPPAVLTDFSGDGVRVGKVEQNGQTAYAVTTEKDGTRTARATYELPVPDLTKGIPLPTGTAAMQRITIELDEGGWEFASPMAARVLPTAGLPATRSGATLVLGPTGTPVVTLQPRRRDVAAEQTQFYAEEANLYLPGPGVVNGVTRVTVRPVQGRVTELDIEVPEGLTVGDVGNGPVGEWRFDPVQRRLHVVIAPAQATSFRIDIQTQRGTAALPADLTLRPLRVDGAAGEVGMIALGFGSDAQPEAVNPQGLSPVNPEDFDAGLLPRGPDGVPLAVLQNVFRYGQEGGQVDLRLTPVAPEVRVATRQVLSLGDDRLVMAVDLNVAITRVGLFKLSFELPDGLEVEALSGPALSHWTPETGADGKRLITLNLTGRTIGNQSFALTLTGAAPAPQAAWAVPRLVLREATRQEGELLLVPERGLRLREAARTNVTPLDPRTVGNTQPGTLAFRLLQADWTLAVGIEALEPWVTVQALEGVTLREGQTLTRLSLRYKVENAPVKQVRLRLPGLGDDQVRTVHATGPAVSDLVKVQGEADLWELHFQRGMVGETDVLVEYQGQAAPAPGVAPIPTPGFVGVPSSVLFVAVRGSGRLELDAAAPPRGWQRADWSAVPSFLQDRADRSVPALCFRVAEPEGPLAVTLSRHEVADALKLRVTKAGLATVFAPEGSSLTTVELAVDVVEPSTLKVTLPAGAKLFNTLVNGEGVALVFEGGAYLFHVGANTGSDHAATVRFAYTVTAAAGGPVVLRGPRLANVPLENVSWQVVLPAGYELASHTGELRLEQEQAAGPFGLRDYEALVAGKKAADARTATALLQQASTYLQNGQQQQAGEALARVSNANALDAASNEDARVQLRVLRTEQAVLGLNTRRQRVYLDNNGDGTVRNAQLEQAANLNPMMKGQTNYDPSQQDQLLMGNTAEENSALRGIAGRLVDQQLAAEPAPEALDVTLPERGQVLTFTRSLQVDGNTPLELTLAVGEARPTNPGWIATVLVAGSVTAGLGWPRRRKP
jgi:hypothetical protein